MKIWPRSKNKKNAGTGVVDLETARGRLFEYIVNELRTPLSVILDRINAAAQEPDDEIRSRLLRTATRNALRIERLAGQLSELTRLEKGVAKRRLRGVDLVPFVESLAMSFEDIADRRGLLLEFYAKRASVYGQVDSEALTTIVSNLVSNAIGNTPTGGRIGVALDFKSPDVMHISVVNTGAGIPAEQVASIFEPLFLFTDDNTEKPDDPGIGLALAHGLAALHGGDITADSDVGRGFRFDVTIPVGVEIAEIGMPLLNEDTDRPLITAEILFRSTIQSIPERSDSGRETVVVVDANSEFRAWVVDTLSKIANVEEASGNEVAQELCSELVPDLVIADDSGGSADGVELTRWLRTDERTSHVPIVLLSAHKDTARRVAAFDAGVDDYLGKPIESRELCAKTANILERVRNLRRQFREQVVIRPADISERSVDQDFLEKVTSVIENSIDVSDFTVQDLGDAVAMSTSQLTRKLRALIDQSPAQLVRRMRLQRAADLVAGNASRITDICFRVGFVDQSHFSRSFKRHFGISPLEYRRQHADEADA